MADCEFHSSCAAVGFPTAYLPLRLAACTAVQDVDTFSIRIAQKDVPRILEILQAVPERKIRSMQAHLGHVWHRYVWVVQLQESQLRYHVMYISLPNLIQVPLHLLAWSCE